MRVVLGVALVGFERRWSDKPPAFKEAVYANRRRLQGDRNKRLQRRRSELVERSFAHICETGGARRSWLRGLEQVNRRYKIVAAARNLGLVMRKLFGIGKPRCLQGSFSFVYFIQIARTVLRTTHLAPHRLKRLNPSMTAELRPAIVAI